jgi:hypothetical protein
MTSVVAVILACAGMACHIFVAVQTRRVMKAGLSGPAGADRRKLSSRLHDAAVRIVPVGLLGSVFFPGLFAAHFLPGTHGAGHQGLQLSIYAPTLTYLTGAPVLLVLGRIVARRELRSGNDDRREQGRAIYRTFLSPGEARTFCVLGGLALFLALTVAAQQASTALQHHARADVVTTGALLVLAVVALLTGPVVGAIAARRQQQRLDADEQRVRLADEAIASTAPPRPS